MKFVFKPVYSWILVPLTFILYIFVPILRAYLIPLMAAIAVIGMIAILLYNSGEELWQQILSFIFHALLLIGLLQIGTLNLNNIINHIIFIICIIFILITPHWPYKMKKEILHYIFVVTYSYCISVVNYLLLKNKKLTNLKII